MTKRNRDDDAALGCVVYAILGIVLMPVISLVLVCSKDPEKKTWGWILLIIGLVLLAILGIGSA